MYHFEIDKIEVFVDVALATYNFANEWRGLSGFHRQQTLFVLQFRKAASRQYTAACRDSHRTTA